MRTGDGCLVTRIRKQMSAEDAAALDSLLLSSVSTERIAILLTEFGWRISYQTVRRHITSICSCGGK